MTHHSPLSNWINGIGGTFAATAGAWLASVSVTMGSLKEIGVMVGVFIGVFVGAFTLFNAYMDARHKWRRDRIEKDADEVDELRD